MNRSRRIVALPLALAFALSTATAALAGDPTTDAGSVTLADGTVLPPMPADMLRPSAGAEMLAEHANDPLPPKSMTTFSIEGATAADGSEVQPLTASTSGFSGPAGTLPNGLRREVLGFLPYWYLSSTHRSALRYDLLSTIAYFSIGAQANGYLLRGTSSSPAIGWTNWNSSALTDVINKAHARGVRVVPTITMMAWNGDYSGMTQLLTSATYRARLVGELVKIIGARNADGVNLDFEPVPSSLRDEFTSFVKQVKTGLKAAGVGSFVTVDSSAGAASWATGYDVQGLTASGAADALMVMGYDLSWSGSSRAGGVAPIDSPYIFDVRQAMRDHLNLTSAKKLIWGVPYYGRAWNTSSASLNSTVRSPASSTAFVYYGTDADGPYGGKVLGQTYGRQWDSVGQVPWVVYRASDGGYRQAYYDDPTSLRAKYRLINGNAMSGVGIWSLGMDTGTSDLWNVLYDQFVKRTVRIAGDDRYATAADISAASYKPGVAVAYLATGSVFADALAGGPAAAKLGGPVLLTGRDSLPAETAAELGRLAPQRIVVLGGPSVVSDAQLAKLGAYTSGTVQRIYGSDRYATAAAVSRATFGSGVAVAYVASGTTFPDALAGGAAAGKAGAPVLLTGATSSVPAATRNELARLKPGRIAVVGGSGIIPDGQLSVLAGYTGGTVTRIAGDDRYATAVEVSQAGFGADAPGTVYLATGTQFPDGLAGAAPAARARGPLLLTTPSSLPDPVAAELRRLNPSTVVVLGGSGSVSSTVINQIHSLWD